MVQFIYYVAKLIELYELKIQNKRLHITYLCVIAIINYSLNNNVIKRLRHWQRRAKITPSIRYITGNPPLSPVITGHRGNILRADLLFHSPPCPPFRAASVRGLQTPQASARTGAVEKFPLRAGNRSWKVVSQAVLCFCTPMPFLGLPRRQWRIRSLRSAISIQNFVAISACSIVKRDFLEFLFSQPLFDLIATDFGA